MYAVVKQAQLHVDDDFPIYERDIPNFERLLKNYMDQVIAQHQVTKRGRVVPTIEEVTRKILTTFGENDTRRLVGLLYMWWPLRDDLKIKYVPDLPGVDENENHLTDHGDHLSLTISKSKYISEPITRDLPPRLAEMFKKYIATNHIKYGDYIFGKGKHSSMVRRMFIKMGMNGNINLIRQMHRKQAVGTRDPTQILNTARNSLHSVRTAEHYDEHSY